MNRFINRVLLFVIGAAALIGCTYNEMTDSYGELDILFDTEDVVLNAGESIEIPFTVTGTEGAAIDLEPPHGQQQTDLQA